MNTNIASTLLPAALLMGLAAAQANDECTGAFTANVGPNLWDNAGATTSTPPFSCEPTQGQADVWFTFTAPTTSTYQFDTCGGTVDTVVEVLSGTCGALTVENCNDDGCGTQSSLVVSCTAGTNYFVRVGGWGGAMGFGNLEITATSAVPNDECSGALPATPGLGVTAWDNTNATTSSPPFSCEPVQGQADIWFSWTATSTGSHIFETCGSTLSDTVLEVVRGSCAGPVIACNDDGCSPFQSRTSGFVTAGQTYFIRIGGWGGATDAGILTISLNTVGNDDCGSALPATVGVTPWDNTGGSTSSPAYSCEPVQGQTDVWYEFIAPATSFYTFETCGSLLSDTVLEVWEGNCGAQNVAGCNDDFCTFQSSVTIPTTAGVSYQIRIGGWGGAEGPGDLIISEFTPPTLDLVAHYKLDETSGAAAIDSSGNGSDGVYNGATQGEMGAAAGTGTSARFNGTSATIDIPATPTLDALRNDLSISAWVNVDAAPSSTYRIFSNQGPAGSWSFALTPNGLAFTTHAILDYAAPAVFTPGTWHHVCAVLDSANDVTFYLDGAAIGTDTGTSASNTPTGEYHIGAWNPGFSIPQFYNGRIDDLQIYTGSFDAADVMELFMTPGVTLGDDSIGTAYCMTNANSTGATSEIFANGSVSVALNNVTLSVGSLPIQSFGFFITARNQGFVANPNGSQGNLCLSGAIGRYVGSGQIQQSDTMGRFSLPINLGLVPQPTGFVAAAPGETWNFQAWHRDFISGQPTSNFTNGVQIMFQ